MISITINAITRVGTIGRAHLRKILNISKPSAPGISTMTGKITRFITTMALTLFGAFISFMTLNASRIRDNYIGWPLYQTLQI